MLKRARKKIHKEAAEGTVANAHIIIYNAIKRWGPVQSRMRGFPTNMCFYLPPNAKENQHAHVTCVHVFVRK